MIIKSLELSNFRNYNSLSMEFDSGTNILYGDNAQGKTNILEAIFVSATTKSHKSSKDKDIVNFIFLLSEKGFSFSLVGKVFVKLAELFKKGGQLHEFFVKLLCFAFGPAYLKACRFDVETVLRAKVKGYFSVDGVFEQV